MQADLSLKEKQAFWETPRNIAILAGAMAAVFGTLGGLVGFRIAQTPAPPPPQIIYLQPAPAAPPAPAR